MNLQTNSLLSRWALRLSVLTMLGTAVGVAQAQPTPRGQPVIRTPQTRPSAAPTAGPATPPAKPGGPAAPPANPPGPAGPTTPPAKPGGPAAPNQPGEKPDDMGLKQAPKEIDFKPAPPGATFQFNLEDADLPELVKAISGITGKRFIYGGKLRQIKVTVVCPEKVSAAEAYQAFLSIL